MGGGASIVEKSDKAFSITESSRICIVGAGPAGIHMASMLNKMGCKGVVVMEKSEQNDQFGKTHSYKLDATGDVPHEMGTCYLASSYKTIRDLLKAYVGDDATIQPGGGVGGKYGDLHMPCPQLSAEKNKVALTSTEWLMSTTEKENLQEDLFALPDQFQMFPYMVDVIKYRLLHTSLLGKYDSHTLPPKPSEDKLSELTCTYRELMEKHGLKEILDLSAVGFGSYGFGYDVPAYYGLVFVTPEDVESMILR
jgi:hypothetical protein